MRENVQAASILYQNITEPNREEGTNSKDANFKNSTWKVKRRNPRDKGSQWIFVNSPSLRTEPT
jgi:hypothetical protein